MNRHSLNANEAFRQQSQILVEAFYAASLIIATQIKPHTISETLAKPCSLETARFVLAQESEKKLRQISLSYNTVQRWIRDLADDIKQQVISDIKNAQFGLFSI